MRGKYFFLAFFFAFAGSSLLIWLLDTRAHSVEDLLPITGNLDSAYPLGDDTWLLQLVIKSKIAQPYFRSVVYYPKSMTGVALSGFWSQYFVVGYVEGYKGLRLQLMRETSYMPTLTGSAIASRLLAPKTVPGFFQLLDSAGNLSEGHEIVLTETGLPFRCDGQLRSADYGGSDTTFFTLTYAGKRTAWVTVPAPVRQLPFCAESGIYLQGDDKAWVADKGLKLLSGPLQGRFDMSGAWLGVASQKGCRYLRPVSEDAPWLSREPTSVDSSRSCAERWYSFAGVTMATRKWKTSVTTEQGRVQLAGRAAGLSRTWAVLQREKEIYWKNLRGNESYALPVSSLFSLLPQPR